MTMKPYPCPIKVAGTADRVEDISEPAEHVAVSVLYHSLRLEPLTWREVYEAQTGQINDDYPGTKDQQLYMSWLQYRLNRLGYLAGPLTGKRNDQTRRAIRRLSYAFPGKTETDDESTQGIGVALMSDDRARKDLLETPEALCDPTKSSKILLDHDYFVVQPNAVEDAPTGRGEANKPDGHVDMESQKLDRFEVPLRVTAYLVSKNDRTGRGKGVLAPEVVGEVKCEWHVYDPPEDLSVIGKPFSTVPKASRSRARQYLLASQQKSAQGDPADPLEAYDNCPAALGGIRPEDPADMTSYFRRRGLEGIYDDEVSGKKFLTRFSQRDGNLRLQDLQGTTGVLFRGSYIAGDNWIIQARLSFAGLPGEDKLKELHRALSGLKDCFDTYGADDPLAPMTGKLTLWRRHHVCAAIDWWSNTSPPDIDWDVIVAAFRAAHIVLVPPQGASQQMAALADNTAKQRYVAEMTRIIKAIKPTSGFFRGKPSREAAMQWRDDAIIPMRFPTRNQRDDETFEAFTIDEQAQNTVAHFAGGTYGLYRVPADFARALVGQRAGQVILRFDHLMSADLRAALKAADQKGFDEDTLPFKVLVNHKKDPRGDGGPSIGVSGGVAMIEHQHARQFTAGYLVAHEMGHNYYLTHAADVNADHDKADRNCTMFYPSQTPLGKKSWGRKTGPGVPVPLFCGKCLLKLRGWKVREDPLPKES